MPQQKIVRGGFVHFDSKAQPDRIVAFQFNPETLERVVIPGDPAIQHGELIKFALELDAFEALERGDATASALGIHPAIAALELLAEASSSASGQPTSSPPRGSAAGGGFTVFVWGSQRVLPIRFAQMVVRETLFDERLNPVRAAVDITLEVLSGAELGKNPRAKSFIDFYLKQKESIARQPGSSGPTEELLASIRKQPSG